MPLPYALPTSPLVREVEEAAVDAVPALVRVVLVEAACKNAAVGDADTCARLRCRWVALQQLCVHWLHIADWQGREDPRNRGRCYHALDPVTECPLRRLGRRRAPEAEREAYRLAARSQGPAPA